MSALRILAEEERFEKRIVAENESFVAYIPFFARYPYETHITPKRHLQALTDFSPREEMDLAEILKQILSAFDALFNLSFPYIMAIHGRPSDGENYDFLSFSHRILSAAQNRDETEIFSRKRNRRGNVYQRHFARRKSVGIKKFDKTRRMENRKMKAAELQRKIQTNLRDKSANFSRTGQSQSDRRTHRL